MIPFSLVLLALAIYHAHALSSNKGVAATEDAHEGADRLLSLGDTKLASDSFQEATELYRQGIDALKSQVTSSVDSTLITAISLHTNLGTALSSWGDNEGAVKAYQAAILAYEAGISNMILVDNPAVGEELQQQAKEIAAQSAFFLGMVYQDIGHPQKAVDAYIYANSLDRLHWASLANLGAVYHDELADYVHALEAYNHAYRILTGNEIPTDPPTEPRYILSQLQYRIGLIISHDLTKKCALNDQPDKPVDCKQLAAHAFSLAVQYDSDNESAKHMLAAVTADATIERASNTYVKALFDDYARNFERSLVKELGYTGYERLRIAFDRAIGRSEHIPRFRLVIDAGCGTGLVGEQFRNISQTLVGVDLSEAIIEEAKKARPNLYDEFVAGDVTDVFRSRRPISLIIAGDSFIYFGDLTPLFESMRDGLDTDGYAAFTLENVDHESDKALSKSKADWRWQLTSSGRFAHRKEYVVQLGKAHGMEMIYYEALDGFRVERGVDVRGHAFVLRRKALTTLDQEL